MALDLITGDGAEQHVAVVLGGEDQAGDQRSFDQRALAERSLDGRVPGRVDLLPQRLGGRRVERGHGDDDGPAPYVAMSGSGGLRCGRPAMVGGEPEGGLLPSRAPPGSVFSMMGWVGSL